MKFRYKKFGSGVLRPVIPVEIGHGTASIPYEVLVDSGADFCIFDAGIAELLDIDLQSGIPAQVVGITGTLETYYIHQVRLTIGGWPYDVAVGFLQNIARMGYGVVGQNGFFDKFVVKFDLASEEVELKRKEK
jgi:hypothetical protein